MTTSWSRRVLVEEIRSQRELLAAENNELVVNPILPLATVLEMGFTHRNTPSARARDTLHQGCETIFNSDERLLGRVVGNLVKNALEASPVGGTVTLGCSVKGKEISFWCNNSGVIPRETQLQIFHRSFSTKEPGRGIGTYSVKILTERYLKGRVAFASNADDGTTFTVTYPLDIPG
jgi:signal transduction histidine kinase